MVATALSTEISVGASNGSRAVHKRYNTTPKLKRSLRTVHRAPVSLLGRHKLGSAHQGVTGRRVECPIARQAEIEDLDPALGRFQPDVRGLDVAMNQAGGVGRTQSLRDFATDANDLADRKLAFPLQIAIETIPLEQLHRDEGNAVFLAHLIDRDDIVMLDFGGRLGLAQETLMRLPIMHMFGEYDLDAARRLSSVSSASKTAPMPPRPITSSTRKCSNRPNSPLANGGERKGATSIFGFGAGGTYVPVSASEGLTGVRGLASRTVLTTFFGPAGSGMALLQSRH